MIRHLINKTLDSRVFRMVRSIAATRRVMRICLNHATGLRIALAILWLLPTAVTAQDGAVFRIDQLTIVSSDQRHALQVEIAETPRQRAQGLMWRKHLASGSGMLFDFKKDDQVIMWMKNTYIPLDMLFIEKAGRIINIARNTTPHSTKTIPSAGPARAVLELPAGSARTLGLRAGDTVLHAIFER